MARIDLEARITARDEASKVIAGLSGAISELGNRLKKDLVIASATAGGALAGIGAFSIKAAAQYEQSRIAFETMLGSAEKAGNLLKDISEFARKTPFELPQVVEGSKQLLAYGFSADEVLKQMRMLGDVAAGLSIPLGDLVYVYGTLRAQGRAYTQDIRQFTMRGIPMIEALAQVMHVSQNAVADLVQEGKVGFPEVQKAFELMTSSGGRFAGLMQAQSDSLAGIWSNLKDNLTRFALAFMDISESGEVKKGGLFWRIKEAAMDALTWLDANSERIKAVLSNLVNKIIEFGQKVFEVGKWLMQHKEVAIALGLAFLTLAAALNAPMAALTLIIVVIGLVIEAGIKIWNFIKELGALFVSTFNLIEIEAVAWWNSIVNSFVNLWNSVKGTVEAIFVAITLPFRLAYAIVYGIFYGLYVFFKWIWSMIGDEVTAAVVSIWNTITGWFNAISSFLTGLWTSLVYWWAALWNSWIEQAMRGEWSIGSIVVRIFYFFKNLPGQIWNALVSLYDIIVSPFQRAYNSIVSFAAGIYSGVSFWFERIASGIKAPLNRVIEAINRVIQGYNRLPFTPNLPTIPYFQKGGVMPYEGLAYLHKGERVTPASMVAGGGGGVTVNFYGPVSLASDQNIEEVARKLGRQLVLVRQGVF